MDDADQPRGPRRVKPAVPTMEELRNRFGRALRDQNFWTLMDELGENGAEEASATVVPFPVDRVEDAPARPQGPGRVITLKFPKRG